MYGKANRSENDTATEKRVCYAQSPRGGRNASPLWGPHRGSTALSKEAEGEGTAMSKSLWFPRGGTGEAG